MTPPRHGASCGGKQEYELDNGLQDREFWDEIQVKYRIIAGYPTFLRYGRSHEESRRKQDERKGDPGEEVEGLVQAMSIILIVTM
jgi:hypothetical protein